jgi:hypothetical protein
MLQTYTITVQNFHKQFDSTAIPKRETYWNEKVLFNKNVWFIF